MARPTKMTEEIVNKLEYGFMHDFNITEACQYAGIRRETYHGWVKKNQEFFNRMESARNNLRRLAKITLAESIEEGNVPNSMWYLERRAREEYSTKQTTELTGAIDLQLEDKRQVMEQRLAELREDNE